MKKLVLFLVAIATCITLVGCTSNDGDKVFILTYNNADPNMSSLWKPGFETAAKDLDLKIDWVDGQNDDQKALEALDAAVASNDYVAYLINMVDQSNAQTYLNKVKTTGKPCIFWNREASETVMNSYDDAYYVGIRSAEGGEMQGQMAAEYIKAQLDAGNIVDRNGDGKIGYIVVRGERGHADAEARTTESPKFLASTLTSLGTNLGVEEVALVDGTDTSGASWDPVTATNEVERVLTSDTNNEVDIVLSNNDGMALGIVKGTQFKAAGIPIFGVDALSDALTAVNNGEMQGTIKNDGKTQALVCLQLVKNLMAEENISTGMSDIDGVLPYETQGKAFRVNHLIITKSNVADHI